MPLINLPRWNNACLAYLVPGREDMPHQSPRILVFSRSNPGLEVQPGVTVPGKILHDPDVMRRELCNPDHLPCMFVQIDQLNQYMYLAADENGNSLACHKVINTRIDECEDKASGLILPGQDFSGGTLYRIEMDFLFVEEQDPAVIDLVRMVAFSTGI